MNDMITKDDIRLRVQGDDVAVWISESAVVGLCGVSSLYIRRIRVLYKQSLPESWRKAVDNNEYYLGDSGKAWRYGYKDGKFWYSWDNIPNKAPTFYKSQLPTKEDLIELARGGDGVVVGSAMSRERVLMLREEIACGVDGFLDNRDAELLKLYRHPVSGSCVVKAREAKDMGEATAWVLYIKSVIANHLYQQLGLSTIAEFYEVCATMIDSRKIKSIQRRNGRSLRNRITTLPDSRDMIRECIVSGKYGNRNASIIGKKTMFVDEQTGEMVEIAIHDTITLALWMNFGGAGKHTKIDLYKKYQIDMVEMKERPISLSTFSSYLNRDDIKYLTSRERHGVEYFNKMVQTYVPSRKLEYANSLWCGDASGTMNYVYVARNGDVKTRRLYTVLISDVASGYIVGWAVGRSGESSENGVLVREAMAKALMNPLNDGREVLEFLSDNHSSYSSGGAKQYLKRVARVARRIKAHNSQGNPAERLFKTFKQSLRGLYNLMETSYNSTHIENKANPDYFKNDQLPTYREAIKLLEQHIEKFNSRILTDGSSPAERFELSKNPMCGRYREETFRNITQKPHRIDISSSRGFVEIKENLVKTRYQLPTDIKSIREIAKYVGITMVKAIDIYADGEKADIYSDDGVFMMTVSKTVEACQSHYEATQMEKEALKFHERRKESQKEDIDTFEAELKEDIEILSNSYALNMATGAYGSSPKNRYNEQQEEARDLMMASKVKREKAIARSEKKDKESERDSYVARQAKRLERYSNGAN